MLLTVIKTLVLALKNVVDYLALTMSGFLKNLQTYYYQRVDSKIQQKEELGCWQEPPEDVKEMIVKRMSFSGRVRLSSLCKSWRLVSMRRDIQISPQLPWLVHPQVIGCHSLSFSSFSEGKVFKLRLPSPDFKSRLNKPVEGCDQISFFLRSSRGWLVMLDCDELKGKLLVIFLLNPVSRAQHQLPSLQTIPCYKENSVDSYLNDVVLSSSDVSKCMVAALVNRYKLILCKPRDKSWSDCFQLQVLDENDNLGYICHILFSSTGMLYALVKGSSNCRGEAWIENRSLKFGDDEVKLKVIYDKEDRQIIDAGLYIQEGVRCRSFLSETTNNELLLIYQIIGPNVDEDVMEGNVVAEEGNNNNNNNNGEGDENNMEDNEQNENVLGRRFVHPRTRSFRVYKIDPDNNNFRRVQDLGDQILFLADDDSSLSLSASDFKELQGNCIYFATTRTELKTLHTLREIGIFYLDSGRIERSIFPSFEMPQIPEYSRLSWFMQSLW